MKNAKSGSNESLENGPLYPTNRRSKRIRILDASGHSIMNIDVSDIPNGDCRASFTMIVQAQCDLGYWHKIGETITLPLWGSD